jgi:NADPH:quinone reductase-like Zn-dependent oxidoreductase
MKERVMKGMVCTVYGPPEVLHLQELEKPSPADDEVLVRVYAASVNPLDSYIIRGPSALLPALARLIKPKSLVPGADIAGRVEAVGEFVKQFHPGDEVFGGLFGGKSTGAFAEYACARENQLGLKPIGISFEEAAAAPIAAITALQGLRDKGGIARDHKVLIDGASGGVGTYAIQIAKSFGAEVTAVCSTRNVEMARKLGADHVIDYKQEDFTRNGRTYDLILGANSHHPIFAYRRCLTADGTFVMVGGALGVILRYMLLAPFLNRTSSKKMRFFIAKMNTEDLDFLADLLARGKMVSVIDRRYPLSDTVEAFRYREAGHAQGKVVITVVPSTTN